MKLPIVSSDKLIKLLKDLGFEFTRQKGSHISLHKKTSEEIILVVVPKKKEIKKGTLLSILKKAHLNREEFMRLLRK